jgi:hypothetical protein
MFAAFNMPGNKRGRRFAAAAHSPISCAGRQ